MNHQINKNASSTVIRLSGLTFYSPFVGWIKLTLRSAAKEEVVWEPRASLCEQSQSTLGCVLSWALFLGGGWSISLSAPTSAPLSLFLYTQLLEFQILEESTGRMGWGGREEKRTWPVEILDHCRPCFFAWAWGSASQVCSLSTISHSVRADLFYKMTHTQGPGWLIRSTLSDSQLLKMPSRFRP